MTSHSTSDSSRAVSRAVQSGRVASEGDTLFYEVRGNGDPLLLIPPAGGDGWQYARLADVLSDAFKVVTFDRRANGRSTMNPPQNFAVAQQSRDAVAVLHDIGETSAFVFGNSSGAVIALDMATTQPRAVRLAVAHEGPMARLHPNAKKWQRFFAQVYLTSTQFGASLAALQFMLGAQLPVRQMIEASKDVNLHQRQSQDKYIDARTAADVLIKWELLPITNYVPDVQQIKANGVKVVVGVSQWGADRSAWLVEANKVLAQQFGSEPVTFPGHHGAFLDTPDRFAAVLRQIVLENSRN